VFELSPGANGSWTETVLYNFCSLPNCEDGAFPVAGLVFDTDGNLYGTTSAGGSSTCSGGCGTIFKLTPGKAGTWEETLIYSFDFTHGAYPMADLTFDHAGKLYSTTMLGGAHGRGAVFELTPKSNGQGVEKVLYSFCPKFGCKDGAELHGSLIFDSKGKLYGTTAKGGGSSVCDGGCGTVFVLTPEAHGKWSHTVLKTFHGKDGSLPYSGLVLNSAGELYGTTSAGGACDGPCGTVFQLVRDKNGSWSYKMIHKFDDVHTGANPTGSLVFDGSGNLYGTTALGGGAFEMRAGKNRRWSYKILYAVNYATASLNFDANGNLYGTAEDGTNNFGAVFEVSP
jgi:uncharacterized repeat protein (TIGR03803 family)